MFGWFKKKAADTESIPKPVQQNPEAPPAAVDPTPSSTATPDPGAAAPAPAPAPTPEPMMAASRQAAEPAAAGEPSPKVGMPALEIASKTKRKAVVTFVHPNRARLVARIVTTGTAYTYAKQADGSYRLAGRARAEAPLLVIGAERPLSTRTALSLGLL